MNTSATNKKVCRKQIIYFKFYLIYFSYKFGDLVLLVDNTVLNNCYLTLFDLTKNM